MLIILLQAKVVEDLMDEIRRLKSLLVKHEKRIRALEARASTGEALGTPSPASAVSESSAPAPSNTTAATTSENNESTQMTHDTNANVAKPAPTEEMAPDEV